MKSAKGVMVGDSIEFNGQMFDVVKVSDTELEAVYYPPPEEAATNKLLAKEEGK